MYEIIALGCMIYTGFRIGKGFAYLIAVAVLSKKEVDKLV